jgi:hypothetical protein
VYRRQLFPSFNGLAFGTRATLEIPREPNSALLGIQMQLGGTLTKATISEIVVRIGSRVVWGPITGAQLDAINAFRGATVNASFLTIDFRERDGLSFVAQDIGGIDMGQLGNERVFVEVVNTLGAGSPTISAEGFWGPRQYLRGEDDAAKKGDPAGTDREEQFMAKILRTVVPSGGGTRLNWQPDFRGALVKRLHFFYTGTDWTAGANGNLNRVEVRQRGRFLHDRIECLSNRYGLQNYGRVPQSRVYHVDFTMDNQLNKAIDTRRGNPDVTLDLTAADTVTCFAEVLDAPRNL